jgi:predicted RNase H-like nuclease (RuvC/YqgF family)
VEEEEPEDTGLLNSNNKARRKVEQLEEEKYQLINELESRRSRTPNRQTHSNNIIDYREAIRELSAKNQQMKREIERARSTTPDISPLD